MRRLGLLALMLLAPAMGHATCTVSITNIAFGTYDPSSSTATDSTGTATVTADGASCGTYTIALGRTGTSYNPRVFTSGTTTNFAYNLYTDAARTVIWGDGTANSQVVTGAAPAPNTSKSYTVYGRIPAGQSVAPGAYSASIVATNSTSSGTITPGTLTFTVATTVATCSISATSLNFGTYTGAVLDATSTLTITCSNTTPYNVGLGVGTGTTSTVTNRKMSGPASAILNYALFRNSARTQNWGLTVGTDTVAGTGSGSAQAITVYGRVAAGQSVVPGAYTDTIVATVVY